MKTGIPVDGSGKTFFNRIKKRGESWIALRNAAIKDGTWRMDKRTASLINGTAQNKETPAE